MSKRTIFIVDSHGRCIPRTIQPQPRPEKAILASPLFIALALAIMRGCNGPTQEQKDQAELHRLTLEQKIPLPVDNSNPNR